MTVDEFKKVVSEIGLPQYSDRISKIRPALRIDATTTDAPLELGISRFGGTADLKPSIPWPIVDGIPLWFLGQVNLAEIASAPAAAELPSTGLLSFFFYNSFHAWEMGFEESLDDDETVELSTVLYTADLAGLERRQAPGKTFQTASLTFHDVVTLPDPDPVISALGGDMRSVKAALPMLHAYDGHQLLGYTELDDVIDDELSDRGDRSPWRVLLKLEFQMGLWSWGKGGTLSFAISESDLKRQNFDNVIEYNWSV